MERVGGKGRQDRPQQEQEAKEHLLLGGLMVLSSLSALAGPVTYSTTASQLCVGTSGCGVASQTIGGGSGLTVTFNPIGSNTVNASPTAFGTFGEISVSCVGGGTACGSQSLAGLNLFINITQTLPAPGGSASISGGVIAGSISGTASSASITWSVPNTVNIGVISYGLLDNPFGLMPPSVSGGVTSVRAILTDNTSNTVLEPSTYAMMSAALVGLGLLRKRASK